MQLYFTNTGNTHSPDAAAGGVETTKVSNHTAPVIWVTYSDSITMIVCRYTASSMSELAASAKCAKIQLDSPRISAALALLEETQGTRSLDGCAKGSPYRAPSRSRDTHARAVFRSCNRPLTQSPRGLPRHAARQSLTTQPPETGSGPLQVYLLPAAIQER